MATKTIETAGELYDYPDDAVCHWCGQYSSRYSWATLKGGSKISGNAPRQHRICAKCHPIVAKGIEDAAKIRAESREIKPTRYIERAGASDYRRGEG